MSSMGRTGQWPGFMAPLVACLVTLSLTGLMNFVFVREDLPDAVSGLALLLLLPAPFVVAVLWGSALVVGRPHRLAVAAAGLWFVVSMVLMTPTTVWQLLGPVAAGLLAGLALSLRWRLDVAILALALALSPYLVWTMIEVSPQEQFEMVVEEMLTASEGRLPATADDVQRTTAIAAERDKLSAITEMAQKIYPFMLAVGVLGQSLIILGLVWRALLLLGVYGPGSNRPQMWALPTFSRWRVPFYVVWALVAGIGLFLTRQPQLAYFGLNLALLAAFVLSIQGLAVQFFVTGRAMSPAGRVFYWLVVGTFFGALILAGGIVLGLADQWWDLRKLNAPEPTDESNEEE
jgi:hypothetical protein